MGKELVILWQWQKKKPATGRGSCKKETGQVVGGTDCEGVGCTYGISD